MSDASDAPSPPAPSARQRRRSAPNYAARRMLITTVAITAVIAFGVAGWTVLRDDDGGAFGSGADWKEVAVIDRASGDIAVLDQDGQLDRSIVGLGRVSRAFVVGDRMAFVGANQIVLRGDDASVAIPIDRDSSVTPIRTDDGLHLVIGRPSGGNVRILDVRSGDLLDIAELAGLDDPLLFAETVRWADDGSAFAVADAASFRTIVVRPGETDARYFPAQPVALSDDRVATSQILDRQADIGLFDYDRDSKARVAAEIPAGGVIVDDALIVVSTEGVMSRIAAGDSEAEQLGTLTVAAGGTVVSVDRALDGERLVVTGDVFQTVADLDGNTLFTTTFTAPVTTERPDPTWKCLPVGGEGAFHSIVMLDTGEQLADLSGVEVTGIADDGCTVIGVRDGVTEVIAGAGTVSLGRVRSATLGPDGRTVTRTTTTGATQLLPIDDDLSLGAPIDISDSFTSNAIVVFLD